MGVGQKLVPLRATPLGPTTITLGHCHHGLFRRHLSMTLTPVLKMSMWVLRMSTSSTCGNEGIIRRGHGTSFLTVLSNRGCLNCLPIGGPFLGNDFYNCGLVKRFLVFYSSFCGIGGFKSVFPFNGSSNRVWTPLISLVLLCRNKT